MTTGERIRAARKQAGLTQRELADRLHIAYTGIGQWESDKRKPKRSTLERIAAALGAPVEYLTDPQYIGEVELLEFVCDEWPRASDQLEAAQQEGDQDRIERLEHICVELRKISDNISFARDMQDKLPEEEEKLLELFRQLNRKGQRMILRLATDYVKIPDYLKPSINRGPMPALRAGCDSANVDRKDEHLE